MKKTLCVLGMLLFWPSFVFAADDEQRFTTAIELWLADSDAESLPELAALARDGHVNARLLLSRIEIMDKGLSRYRRGLSRQTSRELFRNVNVASLFGQSWLSVEADLGNELAWLLQQSRHPEVSLPLIQKLHDVGEPQASDHPTRIAALYGTLEQKRYLLKEGPILDDLKPYVKYLLDTPEKHADGLAALRHIATENIEDVDENQSDAMEMAGTLALGYGYGSLDPNNKWYDQVAKWVLEAPSTTPIAQFCKQACQGEVSSCAMTLFALTGGYFEAIRLDTPLETVIPQKRFLESRRARQMTARRAAFTRAETNAELASIAEIAKHSRCLANSIAVLRSKAQP